MERVRLTKIASITEKLDEIAASIQSEDPKMALAIDRMSDHLEKRAAEPMDAPPPMGDTTEPEPEKDPETLLQEHVKNNMDKYKKAFEDLFPTTQMAVKNMEYRGMLLKDKIRVSVDFETNLLNFDALQVLSDKEIGLEATGEKTFKVYNIYLARIKDPTIKMAEYKK